MNFDIFIGLEIHIHLLTKSKIFCGCPNRFGDQPNVNTCPVCAGYPGVLPALNQEAVKQAYKVVRALRCDTPAKAVFERKSYFYPDLPKNYQISQFERPFGVGGYFDLDLGEGSSKRVRLHDVHLEEDAGKMIHRGGDSLIDYNRTGAPLLEIVTKPDLKSGLQAELFLKQFRRLARWLEVCDGNLEKGSLRCDANVSINEPGAGLGVKTEVKNLNSFRFVRKALEFEIKRQAGLLSRGERVIQETRLYDEAADATRSMRSKESSHDYRYFPEPDLPPFYPSAAFLDEVERSLPELPLAKKQRLIQEFDLKESAANFICEESATACFFEESLIRGADPQSAAAWLGGDVRKILNQRQQSLSESPLSVERFVSLLQLISVGKISGKIAKEVLAGIFTTDKDPKNIVEEKGLAQLEDDDTLSRIVNGILASHPQIVEAIRGGEQKQTGFLMGQIMKATSGKANPQKAQKMLKDAIFS